jgi:predicted oxidoreductase
MRRRKRIHIPRRITVFVIKGQPHVRADALKLLVRDFQQLAEHARAARDALDEVEMRGRILAARVNSILNVVNSVRAGKKADTPGK